MFLTPNKMYVNDVVNMQPFGQGLEPIPVFMLVAQH